MLYPLSFVEYEPMSTREQADLYMKIKKWGDMSVKRNM
jgi:hypothetical protein